MALPRKYRLTKEKDIENVFLRGRSFKGNSVLFKYIPNGLNYLRLTVAVSKNISPKATIRNLIRRRIQEIIMSEDNKFVFKVNYDVVIVALSAILGKEFKEIKTEIDQIIKKLFV